MCESRRQMRKWLGSEFRVSARLANNCDPRGVGTQTQGLPCFLSWTAQKGHVRGQAEEQPPTDFHI